MKHFLVWFFMLGSLLLHSTMGEKLFLAEKYYNEKKYKDALEIYKKLESEGYYSSDFYYNMGNIYYRLGKLGYAILYFEKAARLAPANEYIRHNLSVCYSKTTDKVEVNENFFIQSFKSGMMYRLSESAWGWLSVIFSVLAVLGFALSVFFLSAWKQVLIPFGVLCMLVSWGCYGMGRALIRENIRRNFAVVVADEVMVQSEPLPKSFVKFRLHEGAKVKVEETDGDYTLIKLSNGNEGWVKTEGIEFI